MPRSARPRDTAHLSDSVHRRLNSYALAATAAGVSVVALTPLAGARIVYTPVHKLVRINHEVPIDLNHDGIHDFGVFNLTHNSTTPFGSYLRAEPLNSGNQIWVQRTNRGYAAAALSAGIQVGPKAKQFQAGRELMAYRSSSGASQISGGPWKDVSKRYLGLKFLIKGKAHYGWARLDVAIAGPNINATLTGYAYETVPNKAIVTGNTATEATLGVLARGR